MKSPFPGMDPYIEACGLWKDFHYHVIDRIHERLADALPPQYLVRTGERSYVMMVEREGKIEHEFEPDVRVNAPRVTHGRTKRRGAAVAAMVGEEESVAMRPWIAREHREAFVEIYEADDRQRLVTCVEMLSPTNKRPGTVGWEQYQRKRQSVLLGGVNLVEIDLLRGGERMPMRDPWPAGPYSFLVFRAGGAELCRVWPVHYRKPLPTLSIPLLRRHPDIPIELQPVFASIYRRSRYSRSIDYTRPLTPPLEAEDAAWLAERLRRRQSKPKR